MKQADNLDDRAQADSAIAVLDEALSCARHLKNKYFQAKILFEMGKLELRTVGPRDVPTQLFIESLALFTEIGDHKGIVSCNLQLAVLNFDISNFESALEYLNHITTAEVGTPKTRALAYYLSALSYSELNQFSQAEQMFAKAKAYIPEKDTIFRLQLQTFRGKMLINKNEPAKAVSLFDSLMASYKQVIDEESYAPIYAFRARAHLSEKEYNSAILDARKAHHFAMGSGANAIYLREAQSVLHQSFYATGQLDSAYYYLLSLNAIEDSLVSEQIQQRITQMSGQFEFQQQLKAQQAEQLLKNQIAAQEIKREKLYKNLILAGLVVVAIFASIFFVQRGRIAREKQRSDGLLLNILPAEIAQELKENGHAAARTFDRVSILFTDFADFTSIAEKLTATELVAEINHCFKAFDGIMDKYHLEKIKTIGDAYMAAGGLQEPHNTSPADTVKAALEMQSFMQRRKAERISTGLPYFDMRAGIHCGPVVAGIVGIKKFQYDIWGDTVNIASRMESHGTIGKVNISNDTYELVKDESNFQCVSRGKIDTKGKGEMEMWYVYATNM